MLGAVALMAATAVVALANYVEGITVSCFDTWTTGSVTVYDGATGNTLELKAQASTNGGTTWTDIPGATVDIPLKTQTPNQAVDHTYSGWWIPVSSTYLTSTYNDWQVVFDSSTSSGVATATGPPATPEKYSPGTTSSLCSPPHNTPESPLAVGLPLAGLAIFAGAFGVVIRRRRSASAV
jgi:hypothetical protein